MLNTLLSIFLRHKTYWSIKRVIDICIFRIHRLFFNIKNKLIDLSSTTKIIYEIIKLGSYGALLSAGAIYLLELLENLYSVYLNEKIIRLPTLDQKSHDLIQLISQISAAILAIYFATFGIIISSGYQKIRQDIITLLLQEKVNSFYSKWLIHITVFSLFASQLAGLGYSTGFFVYLWIIINSSLALLCLFTVGNRLFYFFDTTALIEKILLPEIKKYIIECSSQKKLSVHFQAHFQKLCEKKIEMIDYLAEVAMTPSNSSKEQLLNIGKCYSRLLFFGIKKEV